MGNIRINIHGLVSIIAIIIMIVVAILEGAAAPILYVVLAVVLYAGTVFLITNRQEAQAEERRYIVSERQQLLQLRVLFGSHIAFVFLIIGLLFFQSRDFVTQAAYFVVAIVFAMIIPFIVITRGGRTKEE